jgi:hypothetical protein
MRFPASNYLAPDPGPGSEPESMDDADVSDVEEGLE